jgi:cysteinyl-tRNA synthetase
MHSNIFRLNIYNSLTRKKEKFEPYKIPYVGMYTCGPTIYDYPTIGNWRTYVLSDLLYRVLMFDGYKVKHVMNLTDVGHLSGDNLGDASQGEDRMGKAAEKEGVDAWTIADRFGSDFVNSFEKLNIIKPQIIPKATDHIKEQIELIKNIESKGLAYRISDGIYFNVHEYEQQGGKYGELSNIDEIRIEGNRIETNKEKLDQRDFALWKFFATGQKRHNMEWDSPWGKGYPGWHIECSAMSMKYLGEKFELHLGGEDLKSTHHPNEIAQSESATGNIPYVKYWVHGAFLKVNGGRMGKSLGNAYNLHDLSKMGFNLVALRYFYLTGHYRKQINFTFDALDSAQKSLDNLIKEVYIDTEHLFDDDERTKIRNNKYFLDFAIAVNDDINMPQALAITWEVAKSSSLSKEEKAILISEFDQILGLNIFSERHNIPENEYIDHSEIPLEVKELIDKRTKARNNKEFLKADKLRLSIEKLGYELEDTADGPVLKAKDEKDS